MSLFKSFDSEHHFPELLWSVTQEDHNYSKENVQKIPYRSITTGKEEIENIDGVTILSFETESDLLEYTDFETQYVNNLMKNNKKNKKKEIRNQVNLRKYNLNDSIVPTKTNDITKIKGWKSKMFTSCMSDQSMESMREEGTNDAVYFVDMSDDSLEEIKYKEDNTSWSSDFFMENSNSLDKFSSKEEDMNNFNVDYMKPFEVDQDLCKINFKQEEIKNCSLKEEVQNYMMTQPELLDMEFLNQENNLTKEDDNIYSSESEDMDVDETNSCSRKFDSAQSLIDDMSSFMIRTFENDEVNILENNSDSDVWSKSDDDDDDAPNSIISVLSSECDYDELVIVEQTSGDLVNFVESLDSLNSIELKDYSLIKGLENTKNLNQVLESVHSELISQDPFIQKVKEYEEAKPNPSEGILESPLLESYLKKFPKLDLDEELYTETTYTDQEIDDLISQNLKADQSSKLTNTGKSFISEKWRSNFDKEKQYPSGFVWVFGKPIMIDNKELIPRKKKKVNSPKTKIRLSGSAERDEEKGNSSDSSCVFVDENISDSSLELLRKFRNTMRFSLNRRILTDEKQIRIAFFKKYKNVFPFFLLCKSFTDDHSNCSVFNNVSLGMVITIGYKRPLPIDVSENIHLLKQNDTIIDSRWAHIAASAVVNPQDEDKSIPRRLVIPVIDSVVSKLMNREVWYEDIVETSKSFTLEDVLVWCPYHSCFSCKCSTPCVFLKNNKLIWKSPYDGYCFNEKEISTIKLINDEPSVKACLYNTENNSARTVGTLFNYHLRNKTQEYTSKMMRSFSNIKFRKSNSYVRLKLNDFNSDVHLQGEKIVEEIVISDESDNEITNTSKIDFPNQMQDKLQVSCKYELSSNVGKVDLPSTQTLLSRLHSDLQKNEKRTIGSHIFEKNGRFRTLYCTSNLNHCSLSGGITLEQKPVLENEFNPKTKTDSPEYGLLCTTAEFGYLTVNEFSIDNISVEDPVERNVYHKFKNLELANTWLNKRFKEKLTFESEETELRWIIAKRGLLSVSKPFDSSIFNDETVMVNKQRNIVKKQTRINKKNNIVSVEPDTNNLKRSIDVSSPQNPVKKIRISDIVKQIEVGKDKSYSANFQTIDKLIRTDSSSIINCKNLNGTAIKKTNLLKINIPGFKPSTILSNENHLNTVNGIIPNFFRRNIENSESSNVDTKPSISTIIRAKENQNMMRVTSLKSITNQFQGTILVNKVEVEKLAVLKKSFPIIVPKSNILLQNKSPDCVLISPTTNKTLPLNIKSTPAKSILKSNFK